MCDCHKKKKRPDGAGAAVFSKASILEDDNPILTERVLPGFLAHLPDPLTVDIFVGESNQKRTIPLRHKERIPRLLKLRVMQRAPGLFPADDPDWQYVGEDGRASVLFQKVGADVQ